LVPAKVVLFLVAALPDVSANAYAIERKLRAEGPYLIPWQPITQFGKQTTMNAVRWR
jgi:hypothetical protein